MPPPHPRGRGGFSRRMSRSISPSPNRHGKRSWLQSSNSDRRHPPRERSPPPHSNRHHARERSPLPAFKGGPRKGYRSPPRYRQSPPRSRSRSPRHEKRPKWRSPHEDANSRQPVHDRRAGPISRSGRRSPSPKPPPKSEDGRRSHQKNRKMTSPPRDKYSGHSEKKKPCLSSPPPKRRSRSHSPGMNFSVKMSRDGKSSRSEKSEEKCPARKVSSSKKKIARITLHKRFTMDDQDPFELNVRDNVTIAILRNPSAKPSEDVTVKTVFDANVFKMVHKKHEGRRPIFDREEIKVWKHDENLTDDPDFERRLVRVKSAPHKVGDSLTRMSPEVLRRAFGLNISGERSRSRSPHRHQEVRLDPRPDPRYEAKYRQRMEKEQELNRRNKSTQKRSVEDDHRRSDSRKNEGRESSKKRGKDETYDLRQALERRRSDKEDSGFHNENSRADDSNTDVFFRDPRRFSDDDRNVIFNRKVSRRDSDFDRGGRRGGRREEELPHRAFGRGRGGNRGGFGFRQDWSPDRGRSVERNREGSWERRNSFRSIERRGERFSVSPPSNRGFRGGSFRGRGRGRDFERDPSDRGSPPIDMYNKYFQHDDRDVSPPMGRGRSSRGRPIDRGFGSKGFRGTRGLRGGRRSRGGFRIRGRGRGGGFPEGVMRDDVSVEREWKHDMYDTLQVDEEETHSVTAN